MTTATEHHDAQLAAIKARHADLRAQIMDPARRVGDVVYTDGSVTRGQLQLEEVWVDARGRLWRHAANTDGGMEMFLDPSAAVRDRHEGLVAALGDPDDTQAAQGFPAKED